MPVRRINKRLLDTVAIPAAAPAFYWDDEIKGFGLKVTPRARKAFLFQYRALPPQGSTVAVRNTPTKRYELGIYPGTTVDKARDLAEAWAKKVRPQPGKSARDPQDEKRRAKANTWDAAVIAYTADMEADGKRTAADVRAALDNHVKWGDRPLAEITRQEANDLIRQIRGKAPVMANRIATHIQAIFNWAVSEGKIDASPMVKLKRTTEAPRERMPSLPEIAEIWRAADAIGFPFGTAIKLLILTGQRREEVAAMQWREIDRDDALWTLPAGRMKSKQAHLVILSPVALAVLKGIKRQSGPYVFGREGKTPVSGWSKAKTRIDKKILEARRQNDPKAEAMPDWRLHDLRRSFTTTLRRLGFEKSFCQRLISHVTHKRGDVADVYDLFWKERPERERAWTAWGAAVMEALK